MGAEQIKSPRTLEELDALSRVRPLTELETIRLERAVLARRDHVSWRWSRADILRLRRHLLGGKKPAQIAILMKGRSERSIWRMMNRLGWTVRDAERWVVNLDDPVTWCAGDNWGRTNRRRKTVQSHDCAESGNG